MHSECGIYTINGNLGNIYVDHQSEKSSATIVPNMPSPSSPDRKKKYIFKFPKTRRGKLALFTDISIFLLVIVILALIEFGIFPYQQSGFYCNDPKISHKFNGDTITMGLLLFTVYITPFILICLVEMRATKYSLPETMSRLWYWYKDFLLGITITIVITEFGKIIIGEPRPHFLDTCKPDTAFNCTTGQFIPRYKCTNTNVRSWFLTDSSRSFPSGHSSLSVFSAFFCVWYIQRCCMGLPCKLVKPFIQTLFLTAAVTCSLSRISDNRHHWWDVLSGAVLGSVCAVYSVVVFCKDFRPSVLSKPRPSPSTCTLLTDTTNKNATSVVL